MPVQVQLRAARIPGLPGVVADHYWFVVDKKSGQERWEIWQDPDVGGVSWRHLHKNLTTCDQGVGAGASRVEQRWTGTAAERLIQQIERSPGAYPHTNRYRYWPGPNSNTYVQWVLDQCRIDLALGPTAIGKDYLGLIGAKNRERIWQFSTPLLGLKSHWPRRVELQLLTLTFAVTTTPGRLILPTHRAKPMKSQEVAP